MKRVFFLQLCLLLTAVAQRTDYYIYSCSLSCSGRSNRRRRWSVTLIPPYWPYGWVHTYLKIGNRCYQHNGNYGEKGNCSSVASCCDSYNEKSLMYRGYTSCPERAEDFHLFWNRNAFGYNLFAWNCQAYVNMLKWILNHCRMFSNLYMHGFGDN